MEALDLDKVKTLKSAEEIQKRVLEMGKALTSQFKGKEPTVICVLTGSFMFYADLIRAMDVDVTCEFLSVSSYKDQKVSSGEVEVVLDIGVPLKDKDVVLVEDLVDSGLTMNYLIDMLKARGPKSLTTVALLSKPQALKVPCKVDLVGFEVGNEFIVGYGIDYAGQYRQLPYIGILKEN